MAKNSKKDPRGIDPIALEGGRRLAQCREANGVSQAALAKLTGYRPDIPRRGSMSPSSIAMYEQGRRRISYEEAQVFSGLFPQWPSLWFMGIVTEQEAKVLLALRLKNSTPLAEVKRFPANPRDRARSRS